MRRIGLGLALSVALAACSPGGGAAARRASGADTTTGTASGSASTATTTGATQVVNAGDGHDACHGDLTGVDMLPLLGAGPLTVNVDASNTSICTFTAANNTGVRITLARG